MSEKVLYICDFNNLETIHHLLTDYTVKNGGYPDFIDMPVKSSERYRGMVANDPKHTVSFNGIPIRKIEATI